MCFYKSLFKIYIHLFLNLNSLQCFSNLIWKVENIITINKEMTKEKDHGSDRNLLSWPFLMKFPCGLNCVPQKVVEIRPLSYLWMWLCLDRKVFVDGHVTMSSLGWALIQYVCVLIKREYLDTKRGTWRESTMRRLEDDATAKESQRLPLLADY